MNDRFKFRAWNFTSKEMKYNLKYPCIEGCTLEDGFEVFETCGEEIMQCTGLKDKNGKLIYEGDILREYFKNGSFMDESIPVKMTNNCGECGWVWGWQMPDDEKRLAVIYEVIGNIYENPELLNSKT